MAKNPFTADRISALTQRIRAHTKAQIISITNERTSQNQRAIAGDLGSQVPITRYVDGVLGKPLVDVKPDGVTLTEFELLGPVIDAAMEVLIRNSPYGPDEGGHYVDDHWLFVNGQRRDAVAEGAAVAVGPGDDIFILNARPYARKIEGGAIERRRRRLTNRRAGLSVQAPDGVYEISAAEIAGRFGNIARVRFAYRALPSGSPPGGLTKNNRFPAIEIEAIR